MGIASQDKVLLCYLSKFQFGKAVTNNALKHICAVLIWHRAGKIASLRASFATYPPPDHSPTPYSLEHIQDIIFDYLFVSIFTPDSPH